jgi:methanethiol S-methyltransferase
MAGIAAVAYGATVYIFFLATFLYAIAFVGNLPVPKTIDGGTPGPLLPSLITDLLLLGLFAVQHSVMARRGFKRWWTRFVPRPVERSTYVLFATAALAVLLWQWRPLPQSIWIVGSPAATVLRAVAWIGWTMVLVSTFLISHFELFGLHQVVARLVRRPPPPPTFRTPFLYRHVRHPIYAGFILAFWATPMMTLGHLVFAVATTGYILIGIWFEERDLLAEFGDHYRRYRKDVGMLFPRLGNRPTAGGSMPDTIIIEPD